MPAVSVFGAQWGDEGKGKIIDRMAGEADVVVRYQGGANAGHTVVVAGQKYVLHLIPSGILHPGKVNVIGNGVALDPLKFLEEVAGLRQRGVRVDGTNLRLSAGAVTIGRWTQSTPPSLRAAMQPSRLGRCSTSMGRD